MSDYFTPSPFLERLAVNPALEPAPIAAPVPVPVDMSPMARLGRLFAPQGNMAIPAMVSNIGANLAGQPGSSPRVDVLHAINRAVTGTALGQQGNAARQPGAQAPAQTAPAAPAAQQNPQQSAIKKLVNAALEIDPNLGGQQGSAADKLPAQLFQANPPQGSEGTSAASSESTPVAANEVPMSNVAANLAGQGGIDPLAIGAIATAFGPETALKVFDIAHNAAAEDAARRTSEAALMKAQVDMAALGPDIAHKRAQVYDIEAKHNPTLAGQMEAAKEGAKQVAALEADHTKRRLFAASPAGAVPLTPDLQKITGVGTQGQAAMIYGVDNLHKLAEHTSAMENARVMAASAIRSQDVAGLRTVQASLTDAINGVNREISKLMITPTTVTETEPQRVEREKVIKALTATRDGYTGQLAEVQSSLTSAGVASTNARRRPTATAAPKETKEASDIPATVEAEIKSKYPKATNIRKAGKIYLFEVNGKPYQAK